jgi:hypothetical protein
MKYYNREQMLIMLVFSVIYMGSIYIVGAEIGAVGPENRPEFVSTIIKLVTSELRVF